MNVMRPNRQLDTAVKITQQVNKGKNLTIPDQSMNPKEALERYSSKTLEEQILTYYQLQGMDNLSDFTRLDQLERLDVLADYRQKVKDLKTKADKKPTPPAPKEASTTSILTDIKNLLTPKTDSK